MNPPSSYKGYKDNITEPSSNQKKPTNRDYDFGWVAALSIERAAALAMLDEEYEPLPQKEGDSNNYSFGRIQHHNIVIASLPDDGYGTVNAATVANNMHRSFPSLREYLMVGIAGGAGGVDVRLGDIVVSTKVIQYDLGKVAKNQLESTAIPLQPSQHLRMAVSALKARHETKPSRIPAILARVAEQNPHMEQYACRESLNDLLFESTYEHPKPRNRYDNEFENSCNNCDTSRLVKRTTRPNNYPKVHYGIVASGNRVIKHAKTRDRLGKQFKAISFEMEGAGLIENLRCLVIRAICDYADSHKNKQWQRYAAATAAAYAKELLCEIPVLEVDGRSVPYNDVASSSLICAPRNNTDNYKHQKDQQYSAAATTAYTGKLLRKTSVLKSEDREKRIATIQGKPGVSKSTLLKFIYMKNKSQAISFFFNARGNKLERSVEGMYRSLLLQLLERFPDLRKVLEGRQLLRTARLAIGMEEFLSLERGDLGIEWALGTLQDLFGEAVARLGRRELICFIDALDECDQAQVQDMVDYFEQLGELSPEPNLKLCFSSRHYPTVAIKSRLTLILEKQSGHSRDLEEYICRNLNVGQNNAQEFKDTLIQKAAGIFIWVVLVVGILNKENRDRLLLSIQWILYAKEPLDPHAYYFAMVAGLDPRNSLSEWDPDQVSTDQMRQFVSSSSKGLAEVTNSAYPTVQFIHESVRDFLIEAGGFRELACEFWPELAKDIRSRSHDRLKECCHAYIRARSPHEEGLGYGDKVGPVWGPHHAFRFPFLKYSVTYILFHAEMAAATLPQDVFLESFDLQTWIELHNIFLSRDEEEYARSTGLFYILDKRNCPRLAATASYHGRINLSALGYKIRRKLSEPTTGCCIL
ncbi:hypothetical protein GQX73_g7296 [Xylaria multiplex]|uniref:Uncharacterized protein n=1 Tax=Xylaria multiplex TaxID=323545 RepID=A0A7C8IKZ8_9PEZI|nr:hypothetical protein GQX73_g7296 [Xylaria multiplex]